MNEDKKPNKKLLIIFLVFTGIVSIIIIWFIFGWLYGPRPALNTIPKAISSYFHSNQSSKIESDDELVSAGGDLNFLQIPKGFQIQTFAQNLGGPNPYVPGVNWGIRQMALKNNIVYATIHEQGKVVALVDKDGDGIADEQKTFLDNLSLPHGIEVYDDWIYVAQNDKIIRVKDSNSDGVPDSSPEKILDLPPLLEHWTRTVRIFADPNDTTNNPDPKMFVSIGSSCSSCTEINPWRASVIECTVDGKDCKIYSNGLRNAVDFTLYQNTIYATETGKDFIGNDIPPEEINILKPGKNYGWPACYGKQVHDSSFDSAKDSCSNTEPSWVDLPAHSTAIGISAYTGTDFPAKYQNNLFVALHGSYQSNPPSGYEVVRIDQATGKVSNFITGFNKDNKTMGRPVHIINYKGGLLISDDQLGKIYFVSYRSK